MGVDVSTGATIMDGGDCTVSVRAAARNLDAYTGSKPHCLAEVDM
ncbi:hypothetical protein [Buttiauxella ferragutiae]|nr:hypothetical protein [Buttiauxella ferragutiae]